MSIRLTSILVVLCLALSGANVYASGGYSGGFTPPAAVDKQKYETGRQIYEKAATVATTPDTTAQAAQQPVLQRWQGSLPSSQKTKVDLPSLAGRLTPAQLNALAHYLAVRFKFNTDAG